MRFLPRRSRFLQKYFSSPDGIVANSAVQLLLPQQRNLSAGGFPISYSLHERDLSRYRDQGNSCNVTNKLP
jgi:hypothetical protein